MSLPKGWVVGVLTDFSQFIRGVTYSKADISNDLTEGFTPILRANNIQSGQLIFDDLVFVNSMRVKTIQHIKQGDVVIAMSSGSKALVGKSAVAKNDLQMSFGAFCGILRPDEAIDKDYFSWFMQSKNYRNKINELSAGVNINNLKPAHFQLIEFPLAPLNEQKRIAEKLDALLASVDAIKKRLDNAPAILKRFRQSVLAAATSGKLTEEWRETYATTINSARNLIEDIKRDRSALLNKEASSGNNESKRLLSKVLKHEFSTSDELLPLGWVWTSFMESMERVVDCHNKTAPYQDEGIYLIRTSDIKEGKINLGKTKFVDEKTYKFWSRRCPPKEGDLFFTREAPMGEVGIVPKDTILCMGQRMMLLRPMHDYILNQYLLYNIMSRSFQNRMQSMALGATVQHLRVGDVEEMIYPLCSLVEQQEIVSRVESLFAVADALEAKIEAASKRVDKLTQSILAKAFKGELVPQDPNDEPAEKLLERIKAEQEKEKATRKKK